MKKFKQFFAEKAVLGLIEFFDVDGIGKIPSKLDSGNGAYNVIHGEDIKVKNGKVSFTLMGKKVTYPLERTYEVKIGSIRDYSEERPVIKLDVKFAGKTYKDEPFGIDDRRDMGTEVLLTRRIMKEMNVVVNPARKFVVTTPYTIDKD